MKFSPKLPAHYTRRIRVNQVQNASQHKVEMLKERRVDVPEKRMFNSLTKRIQEKWVGITNSFMIEKDLIFGVQSSHYSSKAKVGTEDSKPSVGKVDGILDFPQLLKVLPDNVKKSPILSFPLLNPWRIEQFSGDLKETEEEAQRKRSLLLDSAFPPTNFPSVTRVLQSTMTETSVAALDNWKSKMTSQLGEVGFIEHQRKLFHRGSILHRNIALRLTQKEPDREVPEEIQGYWESLSHVFPQISGVRGMERHVTHPFLCYKGVADCIATYENDLVLIDWKTSSRPKAGLSSLYDEPIQAVAYAGEF